MTFRLRNLAIRPLATATVALLCFHPLSPVAQPQESGELRLNPLSSLDPSEVSRFRSRPLFAPSRRPPPMAQRAPADAPVVAPIVRREPPKVRLTGVVQGVTVPMAILQRSDASTSTVRIGDDVDGWLVTSINSLGVMLRNGAHEHEYKLFGADPSLNDTPSATASTKKERRINHPPVDLGANIRAKPPAPP